MAELCARLHVERPGAPGGKGVIYVKSWWFTTRFSLAISDGLDAWICEALEEEVARKAFSWDWSVSQYLEHAEKRLGVQDPTSTYTFAPSSDGTSKLSWTLDRDGVQLAAHWRAEKSPNSQKTTCDILNCLMEGSSRITEELQRKKRSFERMKLEADRAAAQSEKFRDQKLQFEVDVYKKFIAVLNSKKEKLRQLRDQCRLSAPAQGDESKDDKADNTESEDELDDDDDFGEEDGNASRNGEEVPGGDDPGRKKEVDEDSGATDILPDSPRPDSPNAVHSGIMRDADRTEEKPKVSVSPPAADAVPDAATLLRGSAYTSAPRKRRLL